MNGSRTLEESLSNLIRDQRRRVEWYGRAELVELAAEELAEVSRFVTEPPVVRTVEGVAAFRVAVARAIACLSEIDRDTMELVKRQGHLVKTEDLAAGMARVAAEAVS